jgi:hypothetical protein
MHGKAAGTIISMILEMHSEEVISYLEDSNALKNIVEEAHYLLSAPPALNTRLNSLGLGPGPDQ